MKHYSALILSALLCLSVVGCSNQQNSPDKQSAQSSVSESVTETSDNSKADADESAESRQDESSKESKNMIFGIEIVDKDGNSIGEIHQNVGGTMTNHGIFYLVNENADNDQSLTAAAINEGEKSRISYHLYDPQSKEDYSFGIVPEQDYEAGYARIELNDKLYTIITTGNAMDQEPDKMLLLEFDLKEHTIAKYPISDNGFPYTAMTEMDGNLLILNHDQTDTLHDRLYLFDTDTKTTKEVLTFELANDQGDSIRSMYSDGQSLYLLRLHFDGADNVKMMLDTYDRNFQKLSEKDVSSLLAKAVSGSLTADDVVNETKQMVSSFQVLNEKYLYYENFSVTRFLADTESGALFEEISGKTAAASTGSGKKCFCLIYSENKDENLIYEWNNDHLEKTVFNASDDRYYITLISRSPDGNTLIQVDYTDPNNRNNTLPTKLYLL